MVTTRAGSKPDPPSRLAYHAGDTGQLAFLAAAHAFELLTHALQLKPQGLHLVGFGVRVGRAAGVESLHHKPAACQVVLNALQRCLQAAGRVGRVVLLCGASSIRRAGGRPGG